MRIGGFRRTSLVDFPGLVVSTIFLSGCNLRCPFCHNPGLVENPNGDIPESDIFRFLESHRRFVDGVCVSGGEPTLHPDLPGFLERIKSLGLKVKLDTNGYNPDLLAGLIEGGLVDYVAMDIKSSLDSYSKAAGLGVDVSSIRKSIRLLMEGKVDYEFRTTAVPGVVDGKAIGSICREISGAKRYFIQQFRPDVSLLDSGFEGVKPYGKDVLEEFLRIASGFVCVCAIRNA